MCFALQIEGNRHDSRCLMGLYLVLRQKIYGVIERVSIGNYQQ